MIKHWSEKPGHRICDLAHEDEWNFDCIPNADGLLRGGLIELNWAIAIIALGLGQ